MAHFAKLGGKCASIHTQIVRELLPVHRNGKRVVMRQLRLLGEIGKQLCAQAAFGDVLDFLRQQLIFFCKDAQQICYQRNGTGRDHGWLEKKLGPKKQRFYWVPAKTETGRDGVALREKDSPNNAPGPSCANRLRCPQKSSLMMCTSPAITRPNCGGWPQESR